jgi:hypothetical protein
MCQTRNDPVPAGGCRCDHKCRIRGPANSFGCGNVATVSRLSELGALDPKEPGSSAPGDVIRGCLKSFTDKTNGQVRSARFGNVLGCAQRFQRRLGRPGVLFHMHQNQNSVHGGSFRVRRS